MGLLRKYYTQLQEFFLLADGLERVYIKNITTHNAYVITAAAVLTLVMEVGMTVRLFISHPAIDTPSSQVYLKFYLSLILLAGLFLIIQPYLRQWGRNMYWLQFGFVAGYLLWNVLLNSYDLYRNGRGSSLALVTAILFASVLLRFRPRHMMLMQSAAYVLFFYINHQRVEDKINATIAVVVAVLANLLFYVRDIHGVRDQQRLTQMNAQLEKEQMDGAMQYLRRLQEAQTQTAIYHHDLRHTLLLVEQLALQGNLEKIQSFVSDSQENLKGLASVFFCEHEAVNLILGSFYQRATEKNITFEADVQVPTQLALADTELCALLCNLLENALLAAEQVKEVSLRRVYIKALLDGQQLVVLVENGFAQGLEMRNGRPVLTRQDKHHGFGIQSVIDIVERHQGIYVFEHQDHVFQAKVLLYV